ncbi:FecR domain-containing protein [Silvimonas amylolytica]|uniref:FecR protein domain-containing protein n=1 Tax=Silvimonas amylolytica TaxID=449663 RepID=A0ABQ2PGJ9_9NEIS|nr:FecR domain-containing protein [Silvimonas amylolytica]GGP24330.1 hypothetical protein GCM10010971_01490 [Silvimonas amylolytica]
MINSSLLRWLLAALLTCLPLSALAASGQVAAMGGLVTAAHPDGKTNVLHKGDDINKGDVIATGANSWVVLKMEDGASLTLRPNGKLRIIDYVYDPDNPQNGRSWLSLLQGAMRSVTGAIGKLNHDSYQLTTPTATIGIRGTDYDVDVLPPGNDQGLAPGTYHTVHTGGTTIRGKDGSAVNVSPKQDVFTGESAPRPRRMKARQDSMWASIANFDFKEKINGVLDGIHKRVHGGYTLNPQSLTRGRDQVMRYLDAHPEETSRRALHEARGKQGAPEAAMQTHPQYNKWQPGKPLPPVRERSRSHQSAEHKQNRE